MPKDRKDFSEELVTRESESPAHRTRREMRDRLREIEYDDLEDLEDLEIETFEPIKKNGNGRRK